MSDKQWQRQWDLFHEALERLPQEREAFLFPVRTTEAWERLENDILRLEQELKDLGLAAGRNYLGEYLDDRDLEEDDRWGLGHVMPELDPVGSPRSDRETIGYRSPTHSSANDAEL